MKSHYPDAGRVWQRVLTTEPQEQQTLQMLIRQLQLDILYLKHRAKAGDDSVPGLLIREYTGQLQSLRGIVRLVGGNLPKDPGGAADHSLSRCFNHALQRLGAYQLRSSDPVYGPVFRDLARQTEQHCRYVAQLLGQ